MLKNISTASKLKYCTLYVNYVKLSEIIEICHFKQDRLEQFLIIFVSFFNLVSCQESKGLLKNITRTMLSV